MVQNVPSPIDLKNMKDARAWAAAANARPGRTEMLQRFVEELALSGAKSVLELGSGPGFLADLTLRSRARPSTHRRQRRRRQWRIIANDRETSRPCRHEDYAALRSSFRRAGSRRRGRHGVERRECTGA